MERLQVEEGQLQGGLLVGEEGLPPPGILGQQPLTKLTFCDSTFPKVGGCNGWMVPGPWDSCERMDVILGEEAQLSDGTTRDRKGVLDLT